ncbi:MAG: cation diffusion facilitator family transporter [Candidatus Aminicenantes bacterium]|nr:cation diffusion facilitator family transporter [Candidatus Aminicenantes bacterium]
MDRSTERSFSPTPSKRQSLRKAALRLEYFTVAYNVIEAAASLFFGRRAGSVALIGFGLDSLIESLSGGILIWRLRRPPEKDAAREERLEIRAAKLVAVTFFILAAYVVFESVRKLITAEIPERTLPGIIIALLSLLIMPFLALKKKEIGIRLESPALQADAKETLACAFLSAALLLGLGLHYAVGIWFADSIAALIIAVFLIKEGLETWKGEDE